MKKILVLGATGAINRVVDNGKILASMGARGEDTNMDAYLRAQVR